jgi:hypothetical protein
MISVSEAHVVVSTSISHGSVVATREAAQASCRSSISWSSIGDDHSVVPSALPSKGKISGRKVASALIVVVGSTVRGRGDRVAVEKRGCSGKEDVVESIIPDCGKGLTEGDCGVGATDHGTDNEVVPMMI